MARRGEWMPTEPYSGSQARDHLANERTFLAWLRTALALIGGGVLLAKLVESDGTLAEVTGLLLIVAGIVAATYSLSRYRLLRGLIDRGEYHAAHWGPVTVGVLTLAASVGAVIVVLA